MQDMTCYIYKILVKMCYNIFFTKKVQLLLDGKRMLKLLQLKIHK